MVAATETSGRLPSGDFLGRRRASVALGDIVLSHWTADGPPFGHRHAHEDPHFMFVLSGDYVSDAEPGDGRFGTPLIYHPPEICHEDHLAGGAGSFVSISFGPGLSRADRRRKVPAEQAALDGVRPQMLARRITQGLCAKGRHAELEALCLELIGAVWDTGADDRPSPWLEAAKERLSDPHGPTPSLQRLGRTLGVHPVYLTRSFRRVYGCTPGEYARAVRLSAAARMISRGEGGLAEIADACGFSDQSHLTNQFRRAFGLAPGRFRAFTVPNAG